MAKKSKQKSTTRAPRTDGSRVAPPTSPRRDGAAARVREELLGPRDGRVPVPEPAQPIALPEWRREGQVVSAPTLRTLANAVTVEAGAYALIFVLACALRLIALDYHPLSPREAENALAAFRFGQGQGGGAVTSPLLMNANVILFALLGATDAMARLIPALAGSVLVWLPALLRREIGRGGALLTSFLFLISPTLVFFARDLNGVEFAALTGFGAAIWFWRYWETRRARELYVGSIAAALALTSSAAGFTLLLGGVIGFGALWLRGVRARVRLTLARQVMHRACGAMPRSRLARPTCLPRPRSF
jgi:predicted membrane-bound mannosyltransferase